MLVLPMGFCVEVLMMLHGLQELWAYPICLDAYSFLFEYRFFDLRRKFSNTVFRFVFICINKPSKRGRIFRFFCFPSKSIGFNEFPNVVHWKRHLYLMYIPVSTRTCLSCSICFIIPVKGITAITQALIQLRYAGREETHGGVGTKVLSSLHFKTIWTKKGTHFWVSFVMETCNWT